MELARNVLDQQVIDRKGVAMGKVDGVLLELREGAPPRVAAVVLGGVTLASRIHPRLGAWVKRWRKGLPGAVARQTRIPWSRVLKVGNEIKVDANAYRSPALAAERWVRDHIVSHIPGS
jgi:sporulation protein YlmC with PRC-barrel domain